jgi:hypothetical protein
VSGNYHRIFQDGLRYNLDLVQQYGGALTVYALLGVKALILDVLCLLIPSLSSKSNCTYQIHLLCITSL